MPKIKLSLRKNPGVQSELQQIIEILSKGGCIIYPTDTVWGLGCDATNEEAVKKIFSIKKRKDDHPLIILLHNENQLFDYVEEIPEIAFELMELSTRPLTIVFEKGKNLAPQVLGADGSIAIRLCRTRACYELLKKWNKPLVSTSVNLSGQAPALAIEEMDPEILEKVDAIYQKDLILEASQPSQVMKVFANGRIQIIRK